LFNVPPTLALLLGVLELERPQCYSGESAEEGRKVRERYDNRINSRINNWMELIRLAGEPKLPKGSEGSYEKVFVAGIEIGFVNIQERKAWTLE